MLAKQRLALAKACSVRLARNSPAYQILSHDLIEMTGGAEGPLTDIATYNGNNLIDGMIDIEQLFRIMDIIWTKFDVLGLTIPDDIAEVVREHLLIKPEKFINRILLIIKALRLGVTYKTIIDKMNNMPHLFRMLYRLGIFQHISQASYFDATRTHGFMDIVSDRIFFLYIYITQYDPTWIQENIPGSDVLGTPAGGLPPFNDETRDRFLNLLLDKFKELTEQLLGPNNGFTGTFDDL